MSEHLSEQQLQEYFSPRCRPQWREHVVGCPSCASRLQQEGGLEQRLRSLKPIPVGHALAESVLARLEPPQNSLRPFGWLAAAAVGIIFLIAISSGPSPFPLQNVSALLGQAGNAWLNIFNAMLNAWDIAAVNLNKLGSGSVLYFYFPAAAFFFYFSLDAWLQRFSGRSLR